LAAGHRSPQVTGPSRQPPARRLTSARRDRLANLFPTDRRRGRFDSAARSWRNIADLV
jgi:hypothetical protein